MIIRIKEEVYGNE
ncbi:hypothetical protein SBY92_002095 [Candida maltosa Xu316]